MKLPECCGQTLERDGASCVFGCGSVIDDDTKMCPRCRDHSANSFECETCGRVWEKWGDEWETESPPAIEPDLHIGANYKPGHSSDFPF